MFPPTKTVFSAQPYLTLDNQGQVLTLALTLGEHRVGRDPQRADLRVPPDWLVMSGCQALLRRQGNDYLIYDGDGQRPSSNGLFLNHHRLTPQTGHRLACVMQVMGMETTNP